jgi:non-specific serine/threonine protein kinase
VQAGTRLLTLTGVGGCGKTRLALALADELRWAYPHGVCFVDLAPLADPDLLPQTIAAALALRPSGPLPSADALVEALRERRLLLVLDNCEHLLPACAELAATLLRAAPHLEVLATSREPLGIHGETLWQVPPLSLPAAESDGVGGSDAARLFIERLRLQRPDLVMTDADEAFVAAICRQLDGIPLAIELAAARVNVLSIGQIAERLHDRFRLLTSGGRTTRSRHQTLRAAMDWSYDLLTAPERALLGVLSVFAGGFTLEAAEQVTGQVTGQEPHGGEPGTENTGQPSPARPILDPLPPLTSPDVLDLLARLVNKSLVIADTQGGEARYRLLETVRQYAHEKIDGAEETAVRFRHLAWCLRLVTAAERAYHGPDEPRWFDRLEREHDNLRAALAWSLATEHSVGEMALHLAGALARFWELRGRVDEGRQWLTRVLSTGGPVSGSRRATALCGAGGIAFMQGDYAGAHDFVEAGLTVFRALEDESGVAQAEVLLGKIAVRRGEYAAARSVLEAGRARAAAHGVRQVTAAAEFQLALLAMRHADIEEAQQLLEASLDGGGARRDGRAET